MSHNLKRSLKGPVGNKGHHAWDNVTGQIVQVLDECAGQGDISQILQVYNKRAGSRGQEPNRAGTK